MVRVGGSGTSGGNTSTMSIDEATALPGPALDLAQAAETLLRGRREAVLRRPTDLKTGRGAPPPEGIFNEAYVEMAWLLRTAAG